MRECSIEECSNNHKALGYCWKHYKMFKRHGNPLYKKEKKVCSVDECNNIHRAFGLCYNHYQKKYYILRKEQKILRSVI